MSFAVVDAVRKNSRILAAVSGPTGSGKTYSALRVATGFGGTIVVIDTERGRALDYADTFAFKYIDFDEPHSPQRYIEVLDAAEAFNPAVVILDSGSHEWAGVGGATEMHDEIVDRIAGDDYKRREAVSWGAWNKPKQEDRRFISRLTRMRCHIIVCLRAEEKTEMIDDPAKPGKKKVVPKRLLSGHVGWIPVTGKALPYEFTLSLVVTPDKPGVPHAIKLPEPLKPFVLLDQPLSEETGSRLAAWAKGSGAEPSPTAAHPAEGAGGSGKEPAPSASDESGTSMTPPSADVPDQSEDKPLTLATAKRKMNAIVGQLREAGEITTLQLYQAVAADRNIVVEVDGQKLADVETMLAFVPGGKDKAGELHWGPLRDNLNLKEARLLHARLANLWMRVQDKAGAAA